MAVTADGIAKQLFLPFILLVNYSLLQYLMVFYWTRRREPRVVLLFAVGVVGVACLIPFANHDDSLTGSLNDVSESCCVLAFLIQITIIGRDLNKKIKFKTVLYLTYAAEFLIAVDLAMILFSLLFVAWPDLLGVGHASLKDDLPNIGENVTLAYIFLFRFYYIIQSRGWRELYTTRKIEVMWYLLFATHEVPFDILASATGVSWESPQSLWNRLTLAGCLWITAKNKLRMRQGSTATSRVSAGEGQRSSVGRMKRVSVTRRESGKTYAISMSRTQTPDPSTVFVVQRNLQ